MSARVLCLLAALAGVALGALTRDEPPRPALRWREFVVLAADFHVHNSPDGIPSWDAVREARRRRLDVVALTSHNSMSGWWLWTHAPWRPAAGEVMVLPGEELTSVGYHMAIVGLTTPISWRQRAAAAAGAAHAQHAVAILAHPAEKSFRRLVTDDDLGAVDGIEVAHPSQDGWRGRDDRRDAYRRTLALKPGIAAIGSSDFHQFAPIGICRTYVFARERTPDGVLEAVRSGRTVACEPSGATVGPVGLAAVVAERCRDDMRLPPVGETPASRAGAVIAWVSLAALVVAGASRT